MPTVATVVGARPNFIKALPLCEAFARRPGTAHLLVHTGQHYDYGMSQVFFEELGLPAPDIHLGVGSGSHGAQTGRIMAAFDEALDRRPADAVIVVGDVNSTLAAALVAQRRGIPVAHVEAGLRSFDERMPEEINRKLSDHLSRWCFVTEPAGLENLAREGVPPERCLLSGNIMVETLRRCEPAWKARAAWRPLGLEERGYALATFHRAENVDAPERLRAIVELLREVAARVPVVFPVHPRTEKNLRAFGLREGAEGAAGLRIVPPQGYLAFLSLLQGAAFIWSDSGGVQTEAWVLRTPCIVARERSEHRLAVLNGNSILAGLDPARVLPAAERALSGAWRVQGRAPGDGERVGEKIAGAVAGGLGA